MVSMTLDLSRHTLNHIRQLHQLHRLPQAFRLLRLLAGHKDLPADVAEEVQYRLGEMQMQRGKYAAARRHLLAALNHCPENARYHYLTGVALERAEPADLARAAEHYRRSLELDATQTDCLCALGLLALRLGEREEGLRCLREAAEAACDDLAVLRNVVDGLLLANQAAEARGLLLAARFRHPRDARYLGLWNDFQFRQARREQEQANHQRAAGSDEPVLLPFFRVEGRPANPERLPGKILRHDPPSRPAPHLPRVARLPRQRPA